MTACVGWPISMTVFSMSAPVGQSLTQAPQETQSLFKKSVFEPVLIAELKPLFSTVKAKVP
ncbi:hypothetical protein OURE66S_02934 [Oligella ureolytica]